MFSESFAHQNAGSTRSKEHVFFEESFARLKERGSTRSKVEPSQSGASQAPTNQGKAVPSKPTSAERGKPKARKAEPSREKPSRAKLSQAEPSRDELGQAEPSHAKPSRFAIVLLPAAPGPRASVPLSNNLPARLRIWRLDTPSAGPVRKPTSPPDTGKDGPSCQLGPSFRNLHARVRRTHSLQVRDLFPALRPIGFRLAISHPLLPGRKSP